MGPQPQMGNKGFSKGLQAETVNVKNVNADFKAIFIFNRWCKVLILF